MGDCDHDWRRVELIDAEPPLPTYRVLCMVCGGLGIEYTRRSQPAVHPV